MNRRGRRSSGCELMVRLIDEESLPLGCFLCFALRRAPPSEIGAENGHCRATPTFLLTNGDEERLNLVMGRIALEAIDVSSELSTFNLAHSSW